MLNDTCHMPHITKILIANRGEIALRIAATCEKMGIVPISIYAKGEEELPHVTRIKEHHYLGEGTLAETYLNQQKIIDIAKASGADAIHPGYGFLSENARFCENVNKAGLIFIGPTSEVIRLMGDKTEARKCAEKANIPVIPGYHGDEQDAETLMEEATRIGYPVLIKAAAGGGGKGMRIVESYSEFPKLLKAAQDEARNAFGDARVFLEKYITQPRHIEVQVFSDTHGNHVHLFERECSIQRRYQKILEETPSIALDGRLRKKMTETATMLTRHVGYVGAGTVECILDEKGEFYFLEMNTRLQVEHPVTEMVTGLDLVEWQIRVARGEKLPLTQRDIKQNGHAIEVRIYAEDPDNYFLPSSGIIEVTGEVETNHVRFDCGYSPGNPVMLAYDPMLAKLAAWGENRPEAASVLEEALDRLLFAGVKTNREYLKRILVSEPFLNGDTCTDFVSKHAALLQKPELSKQDMARMLAGYLFANNTEHAEDTEQDNSPWVKEGLKGFRNV